MKVGLAQLNLLVGDIQGNADKILDAYQTCVSEGADLVLTPELSLVGYSPMDLMLQKGFVDQNLKALNQVSQKVSKVPLFVGYIDYSELKHGRLFRNAVAMLEGGKVRHQFWKALLPFYDVFDEARYYEPGDEFQVINWNGHKLGVTVCEDIWSGALSGRSWYGQFPVQDLLKQGAEVILNLSASPFRLGKFHLRKKLLSDMSKKAGVPMFYCNTVGACDEVIFDGRSFACNAKGEVIETLASFEEDCRVIDTVSSSKKSIFHSPKNKWEEIFSALKLGLSDYLNKCGFDSVCLGLSGGIDSALVATLAKEVLGADKVFALALPSPYSSKQSEEDALSLVENLGIHFSSFSIEEAFALHKKQFDAFFEGGIGDLVEQNLQARLRGLTLMSYSNQEGHLLLNTSNKSEIALGYCTVYGDLCGGLSPLGDLYKTQVYEFANWFNQEKEIIPLSIIEREPTAELAPHQKDSDTLLPYNDLDPILELYLEEQLALEDIAKIQKIPVSKVAEVCSMIENSEWKRSQSPPVLRISGKAFGFGRRMPIAKYRH